MASSFWCVGRSRFCTLKKAGESTCKRWGLDLGSSPDLNSVFKGGASNSVLNLEPEKRGRQDLSVRCDRAYRQACTDPEAYATGLLSFTQTCSCSAMMPPLPSDGLDCAGCIERSSLGCASRDQFVWDSGIAGAGSVPLNWVVTHALVQLAGTGNSRCLVRQGAKPFPGKKQ